MFIDEIMVLHLLETVMMGESEDKQVVWCSLLGAWLLGARCSRCLVVSCRAGGCWVLGCRTGGVIETRA